MSLANFTIDDLDELAPVASDPLTDGPEEIRNVKQAVKNTFQGWPVFNPYDQAWQWDVTINTGTGDADGGPDKRTFADIGQVFSKLPKGVACEITLATNAAWNIASTKEACYNEVNIRLSGFTLDIEVDTNAADNDYKTQMSRCSLHIQGSGIVNLNVANNAAQPVFPIRVTKTFTFSATEVTFAADTNDGNPAAALTTAGLFGWDGLSNNEIPQVTSRIYDCAFTSTANLFAGSIRRLFSTIPAAPVVPLYESRHQLTNVTGDPSGFWDLRPDGVN